MDLKKVKALIELAKEEGVSSLEVESKDSKICVSFERQSQPLQMPVASNVVMDSAPQKSAPAAIKSQYHEIKSPFVGTFYRASSPSEPPFVKKGDRVSAGQTLCILEAMKIMNEIESDVSGEIVEVCSENESLVEFGQVLFRIKT